MKLQPENGMKKLMNGTVNVKMDFGICVMIQKIFCILLVVLTSILIKKAL